MFYGHYAAYSTVLIPWNTNGSSGQSITRATDGSIRIYKNAVTTERSSSAGITDTEDFDSATGCHMLAIDTSDNTDDGFYAEGNVYHVMLYGSTIDSQTVNQWIGSFALGAVIANMVAISGDSAAADKLESTLDATESSTVNDASATTSSFVTALTQTTNDYYAGGVLVFTSGDLIKQGRRVLAYNGSTKAITLESALTSAPANGDAFLILGRIE